MFGAADPQLRSELGATKKKVRPATSSGLPAQRPQTSIGIGQYRSRPRDSLSNNLGGGAGASAVSSSSSGFVRPPTRQKPPPQALGRLDEDAAD